MPRRDAAYWQEQLEANLQAGAIWRQRAMDAGTAESVLAASGMALGYATQAQACATAMLACQAGPVGIDALPVPKCGHCEDKGGCSECNVCGLCCSCKLYRMHTTECPQGMGLLTPNLATSSATNTRPDDCQLCPHCLGPWHCKTCFTHGPVLVSRGGVQETGRVYGPPDIATVGAGIRHVQFDRALISLSGRPRCDKFYLNEIQRVPEEP